MFLENMNWLKEMLAGCLAIPGVSVGWDVIGPYARFANGFVPLEEAFFYLGFYCTIRAILLVVRYTVKAWAQVPIVGGGGG